MYSEACCGMAVSDPEGRNARHRFLSVFVQEHAVANARDGTGTVRGSRKLLKGGAMRTKYIFQLWLVVLCLGVAAASQPAFAKKKKHSSDAVPLNKVDQPVAPKDKV